MPLQSSGQISLDDLHVEVGGTSGTECSMNDSDIRGLIGLSSASQAAMSAFYGASNAIFFNAKRNSSGNRINLTRTSGSSSTTEQGFIGPTNLVAHTGYAPQTWVANQGSLTSTAFPDGSTITGLVVYGNQGGNQIQIYVDGTPTTNTGFTKIEMTVYATHYGSPPGGGAPYTQTRQWTTTMNRTAAGFVNNQSVNAWNRYWKWETFQNKWTGDSPFGVMGAADSAGTLPELIFT